MLHKLSLLLRALFFKASLETELEEEVKFHLEKEVEQNIARGMSPEAARCAAMRSFGGIERVKEESRDERGIRFLEEVWQDLRYGARMMIKKPVFTLIAVSTLALGICANTVIFSIVNAILLRPLPYRNPDQLVMVWGSSAQWGGQEVANRISHFLSWREQEISLQVGAYSDWNFNVAGNGRPEQLRGMRVSANLFDVLGVRPVIGRAFLTEEDIYGNHRVAVVSFEFWKQRLDGDPNLNDRTVRLNGETYRVIGVMPAGFEVIRAGNVLYGIGSVSHTDLWAPIGFRPGDRQNIVRRLYVIARLKPGITPAQAQSELSNLVRQSASDEDVSVVSLETQVVHNIRRSLLLLWFAVGLVLLIACANVGTLLMMRATARRQEFALRAALGASHRRIMRQLLTEGIVLSLIGGGVGLLLAYSALDLIVAVSPTDLPRKNEIGIDGRILAFTFFISIFSGIGFSLGAVFRMNKSDLIETLKSGSQRATAGSAQRRVGDMLVIGEVALSIVLVIGAGLLLNSFIRLQQVRLGFNPERVLTMQIPLPENKYSTGDSLADFHRRLMERISSLPGVESAALIGQLPLGGLDADFPSFDIEGRPKRDIGEKVEISGAVISADYFRVMGISLKAGRYFTAQDTENSAPVVVINEAAARRYWAGDNPVGSRITALRTLSFEVIGVVEDVRHRSLDKDDNPRMYLHYPQVPERVKPGFLRMCSLVLRSGASPEGVAAAVADQVQAIDTEQPIAGVRTMSQVIASSIATQRFLMTLLSAFAVFALGLVAIGLYGVISYLVDRRTHEIGIRIALGAQHDVVLRMIIGQGIKWALVGSAIGLIAAGALTRLMKVLLFGVSATDPMTFVITALLLLGVALLACWIPARRATKVDPMIVLRSE